jgi:hypothetical protein
MFRLVSYEQCPPGEFQYEQAAGAAKPRRWKSPLILEMAGKVADFRKGNNLPRASSLEALQDIDVANCARLGNNSRWCVDSDAPYVGPSGGGPCAGCGAKVE